MAIYRSPIRIYENQKGKTHVFWEQSTTGLIKNWNLYYATRFQGPYNLVQDNIPNTNHFNGRYTKFVIDRDLLGITKSQNYFLQLTSTDWANAETSLDSRNVRIVYEDDVLLSNRNHVLDTDQQEANAKDIDYITPDTFDGTLQHIGIVRDSTQPISIKISLISYGADVANLAAGEEIMIDSASGFTGLSYDMEVFQPISLNSDRQVRVETDGVNTGKFHLVINRKRIFLHSNDMN